MTREWVNLARFSAVVLACITYGCSDSKNDGAGTAGIRAVGLDPPSAPAGQYTINTAGGRGTTTTGGAGGNIQLNFANGSLGGHIKVFRTGKADASWQFPVQVATYLGDHPLTIGADTTIHTYPAGDDTTVAEGEAHLHEGSTTLSVRTGGSDVTVTGVEVATGVKLTLEPNSGSVATFSLADDFHNAGTVTTALLGSTSNRASLTINCGTYLGESSSAIDLEGADASSGSAGGAGGALTISCAASHASATQSVGNFLNSGAINTSGGQGDTGGGAGGISIHGYNLAANRGTITTVGGMGMVSAGGAGGSFRLRSEYGNCYNSGTIDSSGGSGAVTGGHGGDLDVDVYWPGDLRNTGALTSNGGDAASTCTAGCAGGHGGAVEVYTWGGVLLHAGDVNARGGSGAAGSGGAGGAVFFHAWTDSGWEDDADQTIGNIEISGNINTSGGGGASGGNGGELVVESNPSILPLGQEIILYGYTDLITKGGDGATSGGNAGYAWLNQVPSIAGLNQGPSGGAANYADVHATGGVGAAGTGGNGGTFTLETEYHDGYATNREVVFNFGSLDLSGGSGTTRGGDGGAALMWGYDGAENHGSLTSSGGAASAAGGTGGSAASVPYQSKSSSGTGVQILSDLGAAVNAGAISCNGGGATGATATGGAGGPVVVIGYGASNTAAVSASGGDASTTDGTGGAAQTITLYGGSPGATNSGTFAIRGGTGAAGHAGLHGAVFVDGLDVTGSWLTP